MQHSANGTGRANLIRFGSRSVLLCQSDAGDRSETGRALLESVMRELMVRVGQRSDVSARAVATPSDPVVADHAGADYTATVDAQADAERLTISFAVMPATPDLPAHQERFEAASADRIRFVADTAAHLLDDLIALLDEPTLARMRDWGTKNLHAYLLTAEGVELRRNWSEPSMERAIERLEQAIALDGHLSKAYTELAAAYDFLSSLKTGRTSNERFRVALQSLRERAERARLDPAARKLVKQHGNELANGNLREAEQFSREDLIADPRNPSAYKTYACRLFGARLLDEGTRYLDKAIALFDGDPYWFETNRATPIGAVGDFEEHVRLLQINVERFPEKTINLYGLVVDLAVLGRFREAQRYLARLKTIDPRGAWFQSAQLLMRTLRGDFELGSAALEEELANPLTGDLIRGEVCFTLGDVERGAAYWRGLSTGPLWHVWNYVQQTEHRFKPGVVDDPRYQALLEELGCGVSWTNYMRERAIELTPVTGIEVTTPPSSPRPSAPVRDPLDPALTESARRAALDLVPYSVIVVNEHGTIASTNNAADILLKRSRGLLSRQGRLTAEDRAAANALGEAIARACRGTAESSDPTSLVRCPRGRLGEALHVLVSPIESRSRQPTRTNGQRAAALVIVSDPNATPHPAADALRQLFDLTPALARLAAAMAAGKTVAEYAGDHEVSEGTARGQLKELMARVGVRRQPELVRVLLGGVAQLRTPTVR